MQSDLTEHNKNIVKKKPKNTNKSITQNFNANSKAQTRIKQLRNRLQCNKKLENMDAYNDSSLNL